MLKYSHSLVAERIADKYKLSFINRVALVFGSVLPDCRPSCFLRPHTKDNWSKEMEKLFVRLQKEKRHNFKFFIELGTLLHMYADFFTFPHTNLNIHYIKSGHAKWERQLHKELKRCFKIINVSFIGSIDVDIDDISALYYKELSSIKTDCNYIILISSLVCQKVGLEEIPESSSQQEQVKRIVNQYSSEQLIQIILASLSVQPKYC